MAERQYRTLTKRTVDRLAVNGKDTVFWVPASAFECTPRARRSSSSRRAPSTAPSASASEPMATPASPSTTPARGKATDVIARINAGEPPVVPAPPPDPTVADLAKRYEREYDAMHCKPVIISHYRLMLRKHIVLALGERRVADVEHKDISPSTTACTTCRPSLTGRPTFW